MKEEVKSGFNINNIILIESNFKRVSNVVFDETIENDVHISVEVAVANPIITVVETVDLVQQNQDVEQVRISVKMIGIFESIGESAITDLDSFGKINGAAIIYPYIREHITNISLKGGLGPIIIPPANFTNNK